MSLEGIPKKTIVTETKLTKEQEHASRLESDADNLLGRITYSAITTLRESDFSADNFSPHNLAGEFEERFKHYVKGMGIDFVSPFDYDEALVDGERQVCWGTVTMYGKEIASYNGPNLNGFEAVRFDFPNLTEGIKRFVTEVYAKGK